MPLAAPALATLRAMLDRLIPRDDFPGATDADVDVYVLRQLRGDLAAELPLVTGGLMALEAEARGLHARGFSALDAAPLDALLEAVSHGDVRTTWSVDPVAFFDCLVALAAEGFYADPGQGGNRDEVSWKMVGYARRAPDRPSAP